MKIVFDVEANALENPTRIWVIVCKDIDTGKFHIFRNLHDREEAERFILFCNVVTSYIGHNVLGYDIPVIHNITGYQIPVERVTDTLVVSKLVDYSRPAHSIEQYGEEFGYPKIKFNDFSKYSEEMEEYCVRDVDICERVYNKYRRIINDPSWSDALQTEHAFQLVVNDLSSNGFSFNVAKASKLLLKVEKELGEVDAEIEKAFPPRLKLVREITPKATKHGTISLSSIPLKIRKEEGSDLSAYSPDAPFSFCAWTPFNPSSHKQLIEVLNEAGWSPVDKTQTHIDTERELQRLKYQRNRDITLDIRISELHTSLDKLRKSGWKINENNLATLPDKAPSPARALAKRILLEARRRTLTEWINLVCFEIKINKESINVLGREINAHLIQNGVPRNSNITEKDIAKEILSYLENRTCTTEIFTHKKNVNVNTTLNITTSLLLKSLIEWLRSKKVSAQYVKEDENFVWITVTPSEQSEDYSANLVTQCLDGLKTTGLQSSITSTRIRGKFYGIGAWTHRMAHQQPNTANIPTDAKLFGAEMRSLWCAPRNRLLVGVDAEGIQLRIFAHYINDPEFTDALVKGKKDDKTDPHSLNQRILGSVCKSRQAAKRCIYALLLGAGLGKIAEVLECSEPEAKEALDRLLVRYTGWDFLKKEVLPKDGERGWFLGLDKRKVRIPGDTAGGRKHLAMSGYLQNGEAVVMKLACLKWANKLKDFDAKLVNFVHDEWQVECPNNMTIALDIARMMANSLKEVGEDLKLNCPLAGSYWNDDLKDYTIGTNWKVTH